MTILVIVLSAVVDSLLVTLFALIGRLSHNHQIDASGILNTSWPFLVGLTIGWFVTLAWRRPRTIWPVGIGVWLFTALIGTALRAVNGGSIDITFVIVTTLVLGVFLPGWRVLALFSSRKPIA